MNPEQLYQSRQEEWKRLTQLLDKSQQGISRLSPEEVRQLGALYRAATSDLALAQRDFPGHRVTLYLNQLVSRAHAVVYRSEPLASSRLWHFVRAGFPQAYRETLPYTVVAALFFILPALLSGLLTVRQPEAAAWLLPAQVQELIPLIEQQQLWTDIPIAERPYASSFIIQNNIQVTFMAFGAGILAALPAAWVMISNGLLLGGLTGLTAHHGVGFELWTFVIGHGVIELSVIFMAGGAGLSLGWAIIQPGLLRRQDALAQQARQVVQLIIGGAALLIIAGLIEGFISPSETIAPVIKWGVGLGTGLLLYSYLLLAGRGEEKEATSNL